MNDNTTDIYEKNMTLLKKHHPAVWQGLQEENAAPLGKIISAKDGKKNLQVKSANGQDLLLHTENDPASEIPQFLAMVDPSSSGTVIMLGMGLGYTIKALIKERPSIRHFIVFETEAGILNQALMHNDFTDILSDRRLILCIGRDPQTAAVLAQVSTTLQLEAIHTLKHMPSFSFAPDLYKKISDEVFSQVSSYNVEGNTNMHFGRDFMANRFRHFSSMPHDNLLENLKDSFKDVPAIIVAGGPSLDKNVHLLKELKGKAVIIAVDSVLPSLLAHGVTPDFLTSIDPQDATYEKIASMEDKVKDLSLICMSWVTTKVPKNFPADHVFWTFSAKPFEKWLNNLLGGSMLTSGAGTVAHLNLMSAMVMGCSPIVFIGQDLAYTGGKDHTSHAVLQHKNLMERTMKSPDLMWVEDINGEKIATNRSFYGMKEHFERMMSSNPGHYINSTEGGANLIGTEVMPLKDVADKYCSDSHDIKKRLTGSIKQNTQPNHDKIVKEFKATIKKAANLQKTIKQADSLSLNVQKELDSLKAKNQSFKNFASLPSNVQQKIVKIDGFHKKLDSAKKIWTLLEEITLAALKQSERLQHEVKMLEGNSERYMEWLDKNLERFLAINSARSKVLIFLQENISTLIDFYTKEQKLTDALTGPDEQTSRLELAQLYIESKDMVLAEPVVKRILEDSPNNAEAHLDLGIIFLHRAKFNEAEKHLLRAADLDQNLASRIKSLRKELGDEYLNYAVNYKKHDINTAKWLLFKALRYDPGHQAIKSSIQHQADEEYKQIIAAAEKNSLAQVESIISSWYNNLTENPYLSACLTNEFMVTIYKGYAELQINKENFKDAAISINLALQHSPEDAQLHVHLADTYFSLNNFDEGIAHIQRAVSLDRNCGAYWEKIGTTLQEIGQFEDAIIAYENCFAALPENIMLLKKIGTCYQALNQPEAAREAFRILRDKAVHMTQPVEQESANSGVTF